MHLHLFRRILHVRNYLDDLLLTVENYEQLHPDDEQAFATMEEQVIPLNGELPEAIYSLDKFNHLCYKK